MVIALAHEGNQTRCRRRDGWRSDRGAHLRSREIATQLQRCACMKRWRAYSGHQNKLPLKAPRHVSQRNNEKHFNATQDLCACARARTVSPTPRLHLTSTISPISKSSCIGPSACTSQGPAECADPLSSASIAAAASGCGVRVLLAPTSACPADSCTAAAAA
eukprot:4092172-Pleurochrysis_carterae.AAC.2